MIGKTNSRQGAGAAQETVNIRLTSNQSEHSGLVGAVFTLSYGTFSKEYTWNGNEVIASIPAYVTYTVEFGDMEGYNTPESVTRTAVEDNAITIEGTYTCELLTVNVSADEGAVDGFEVTIGKGEKIDLPSDYTFLEYIESTGAQYIDTGFMANNNTRVVMDCQFSSTPTANTSLFGGRTAASSLNYAFLYIASGTCALQLRSDYNGAYTNGFTFPGTTRFVVDKNKETTTVQGTTLSYTNATFQCAYNMYLFCLNNAGTKQWYAKMKVYSCKIYDNGVLIRDYVPALNSSGVAGLYDMANGVFYASSSSTAFVAGAEVENPFTRLDYIESSGSQYIDTGFKPNQDTRVVMDFSASASYSSIAPLFGARDSAQVKCFIAWIKDAAIYPNYGSVSYSVNGSITNDISQRLVYDMNKNVITVDSTSITSSTATFSTSYSLYLMGLNSGGTLDSRLVSGKIYSCQIYDNGTLVRNYIPATRYDGTTGLYDKANGTFYISASGTDFIAGDEVVGAGETIAVQTTATGSYRIPFGTDYTVSASDVEGFTTPESISRTASEVSFVADMEYLKVTHAGTTSPTNGVYIQDTDGYFHTADEWDGTYTVRGVSVITDNCRFRIIKFGSEEVTWGDYGTLISGVTTVTASYSAERDYDGYEQTATLLSSITDNIYAAQTVDGYGGYLGAAGEWRAVMDNLTEVNKALSTIGGSELSGDYWTSTQFDEEWAWIASVSGLATNSRRKNVEVKVRAFAAL